MMAEDEIVIYGTHWCGDCSRARRYFDRFNINYKWIDIDNDSEAEALVYSINHGFRSVPTIIFPDGSIIVEPSDYQLKEITGTLLSSI
jgi:mycoredoxin